MKARRPPRDRREARRRGPPCRLCDQESPLPRQSETDGRSLPFSLGLDPDPTAVQSHDFFDQGEADACPFDARIESVEEPEYLFLVARLDPDTIVSKKDDHLIPGIPPPDLDPRSRLIAHEFDAVADQVLHDSGQLTCISDNDRQPVSNPDLNSSRCNATAQCHQDLTYEILQRNLRRLAQCTPQIGKIRLRAHGGRIWVESEGRDAGSSFCFTLPGDRHRDEASATGPS